MGRHVAQEYSVKNTFVDVQIPAEEYGRSQRAHSDGNFPIEAPDPKTDYMSARTPSPFMHPCQDPTDACLMMQMQLPGNGYDCGVEGGMSIAFGDFSSSDFELSGFDGSNNIDQNINFGNMAYDPSTGMYMPYDWGMQGGYDCYNMMGGMPVEGAVDEFGNCMTMMPNGCNGHTEQLLAALSDKIAQDRVDIGQTGIDYQDGNIVMQDGFGVEPLPECMESNGINMGNDYADGSWDGVDSVQQPWAEDGRGRRKGRDRERGDRGARNNGSQEQSSPHDSSAADSEAVQQHQGPVNFTTVMFRNIPNKYTREMLVKQLEQDLKGHFDFVYLPIDFKNQCNVGYAFINFRSTEACEIFLSNFNGVEVRKCLPGLNSRKVTEVTPARVQGFEDNVQRLRNSPVMRELSHHPEWMPLIFNENGVQITFPNPERALEPIKPRRRAREEVVAGAGA